MINYGKNLHKLAVIVDILDDNRVLLDGPTTDVAREVYPLKRVYLTAITVKILRGARSKTLK